MKVQNGEGPVLGNRDYSFKIFLILLRLIDKTRNEKNRRNFHLALQVERGGPGTLVRPGSPPAFLSHTHPLQVWVPYLLTESHIFLKLQTLWVF